MKKTIIILAMLSVLLPIRINALESSEITSDTVTLSKCVDGNSARFMLGLSEIKVKFLGIDVEEKIKDKSTGQIDENYISNYVCEALTSAKKITIEYEPGIEKEDKYGRIQAWVIIDDELLQEDLLKNGYAKVMYLNDEYTYKDEIKEAQDYAQENRLGIWEDEQVEKENKETKEKNSKGFFETIFDFIGDLFQKILDFIDNLISDIF